MNIAVYSGSFNPLHIGHLAIIRHLIDKEGYDMVYLIVSPKNPLKEGISSASAQDRFEAAKKAVLRRFSDRDSKISQSDIISRVKVDDIELNLPEPHYTIRTLDALREREPENMFTLVIGADNLATIKKWKDYSRILQEYGIVVFPRTGTNLEDVIRDLMSEDSSYKIHQIDAPKVDISSSEIREAISQGKDVSSLMM